MHDIILIKPFAPVPFLFSNYPGKIYFEFKKQLIKSNPINLHYSPVIIIKSCSKTMHVANNNQIN
jgi:hypothetical protein